MKTETVSVKQNDRGTLVLKSHLNCSTLNPKEMLLHAAASCAGMTLQYLLRREQLPVQGVEVSVSGVLSTEELKPESIFTGFKAIYTVTCDEKDAERIRPLVARMHDEQCGLMRMLRMIAPVACEIRAGAPETAVKNR